MKYFGTFIFGLLLLTNSFAQSTTEIGSDSTITASDAPLISDSQKSLEDAELIEMFAKRFNPRKAGLYSAVLPGMGQVYNKKYWKLPIIYGGFIGLGFGINFYQTEHKKFRKELFDLLESEEDVSSQNQLTEDQLRTIVNSTRRERDYFLVLTGILYLLNVVDAHIDSHLKEFDLNEKLKLSLDPMIRQQNDLQAGFSISLNFH
jgi:hypothetical protein